MLSILGLFWDDRGDFGCVSSLSSDIYMFVIIKLFFTIMWPVFILM